MKDALIKFLGLKRELREIRIKKEVLAKISGLSKDSHPKEFLAYLDADMKKDVMTVKDLIFQPYMATEQSAMPHLSQQVLIDPVVGSVHSHPGSSNKPSRADLHFFQKTGIIHAIIKNPYREEDIQFYDYNGNKIEPKII